MCSVEGCDQIANGCRGWCRKHYARWRRHGDPLATTSNRDLPLLDRFWMKVDKHGPRFSNRGRCWDWTASLDGDGYAQFVHPNGKRASRFILSIALGRSLLPVEDVDHLCRRPSCVRPSHLEAVTRRVNVLRGFGPTAINAAKTHCVHGHEFTEENTWYRSNGQRQCRTCNRQRQAARRSERISAQAVA